MSALEARIETVTTGLEREGVARYRAAGNQSSSPLLRI
jgi:hypothetical protein